MRGGFLLQWGGGGKNILRPIITYLEQTIIYQRGILFPGGGKKNWTQGGPNIFWMGQHVGPEFFN